MAALQKRPPPPLTVIWKTFFLFFPADGVRLASTGLILHDADRCRAGSAKAQSSQAQPKETTTTQPRTPHTDPATVRPFRVSILEEALNDLRRRITATQQPEKETVADQLQGGRLATMQAIGRYWATIYDWRKAEAKLNALSQFIREIRD